jgi:hypothetical protein
MSSAARSPRYAVARSQGELGAAEVRGELAELRGELLERIAGQTRSLIVAMVGTNAALATLVLAAVTLT